MAGEVQLRRHGALDGLAEALAAASSDALRIEVAPARSVLNLRGTPADPSLVTDVQRVLGIELPLEPNRWRGDDRLTAVWLGPDEWLLSAPDDEAGRIEEGMREARPADPWLSIVNVSNNYTRLLLSGPDVRELLAKGCALDLHPDVFSRGDCVQTNLARSRVLLCAIDRNSFEVCVRNSFARYLAEWLLNASAEMPRAVPVRILFVCSECRLRSPTAAAVFSEYSGVEAISAGTNSDSETPVSGDLIEWADIILVMERSHRRKIQKKFRETLKDKRIGVLDIPDHFDFMDPLLVRLLQNRVARYVRF